MYKKSPLQGSFYTLQGICAIRKLFSGPVDVVRVLAAVDAAAVPDRVGRQVICPGVVACGVEVHAVLGGIIIDLTAVGGVGQGLADVDIVAALAQRHVGQQVVDRGNAGVVQAGLGCHDILLHAGDGLDVELDAGVKLFSQHIDQALIVGKEAVLTALHNKVVGADKDVGLLPPGRMPPRWAPC